MGKQGKLTIELVELSKNKTIREMFTNEAAGREIDVFAGQRGLHTVLFKKPTGERDGVEFTGEIAALREFLEKYLGDDAESGVYMFKEH